MNINNNKFSPPLTSIHFIIFFCRQYIFRMNFKTWISKINYKSITLEACGSYIVSIIVISGTAVRFCFLLSFLFLTFSIFLCLILYLRYRNNNKIDRMTWSSFSIDICTFIIILHSSSIKVFILFDFVRGWRLSDTKEVTQSEWNQNGIKWNRAY